MVTRKRIKKDIEHPKEKPKDSKNINDEQVNEIEKKKYGWISMTMLGNILKVLILIIIIPAFLNFAALVREEKELKPEGVLIDVKHGQKLFKSCLGTGKPTVILDAPCGETSDVWSLIFPAIAKITKVCVYDRAGLGFSDRVTKGVNETRNSGMAHTVERMVEDLSKLFENEEKPYLLVGADLGATIVKFYSQIFQDSVASLVLINPIFEGMFLGNDNPWTKYWFNLFLPSLQLQHICSALGLTRIGLQTGLLHEPLGYSETPDDVRRRQKYLKCKPGHVSSVVEESYFLNESLSQARMLHKLRPFPSDIPVSVIWTEQYKEKLTEDTTQVWRKSQEMFAKTLTATNYEATTLEGFMPKTLFTKHRPIAELIEKSVLEWRSRWKINAKY